MHQFKSKGDDKFFKNSRKMLFINEFFNRFLGSQIGQESFWSILIKVVFTGLSFLISVLLARILGPSEYGNYAHLFALAALLLVPAQFGLPIIIVRETSQNLMQQKYGVVKGIWHWSVRMNVLFSFCIFIVVSLITWFWPDIFTKEYTVALLIALLLNSLLTLGNLQGAALRGFHKIILGQLPEFIFRPALFVAILLTLGLLGRHGLKAAEVMILYLLVSAFSFIFGWWLLRRETPIHIRNTSPSFETRSWVLSALPLAFISGMTLILNRIDVIILGFFVKSSDIGVYRVAVQTSLLAAFGLQALNLVVAPRFASMFSQREMKKLQRVVSLSSRLIMGFTLVIIIVLIIIGEQFLRIVYGSSYEAAYFPLIILLGGQVVNSAVGSVGFLLNMTGHERDAAKGMFVATILNIFLNLLLVPFFGINGAALATSSSLITWNIILWWLVQRRLGINSFAFGRMGA